MNDGISLAAHDAAAAGVGERGPSGDNAAARVRGIERRYYLAMAAPFAIDVVISLIVALIIAQPGLIIRNLATAAVVLLLGVHLGARGLFRPIRLFLDGAAPFAAIERPLTQLALRSAVLAAVLYLPLLLFRIVVPMVLAGLAPDIAELHPTWTDALVTVTVQTAFIFVVVYFIVSGFLETLCGFLYERHGVNLGLFFGRFALKVAVALCFCAVAPPALMAADIFSYTGERLMREVAIDLVASVFGLAITLFWVSRSLTRPLTRLDTGMGRVAGGDLDVRLPVTSNEEIGKLTSRFNEMVEGLRERRRIRETFGKYVSESVASALLQQSGDGRLSGETRNATLLFTDIDGFTTLSERLRPDTLIAVLNEYLEVVVEPIQRHGGVVNSFIGDGLFATFNLPLANESHAASALAAAVAIQRALKDRLFAGNVRLATRVGVTTGPVIGGTIGAGDRLSYTILGDAVNVASRLQELNKAHGTRILVSDATRRLAGGSFRFRPIGEVPIRGRTEALVIYAVEDD